MKVLTIKQPWATLIAKGYKEYEFRTWNTKYRGELLIHAGKGIDKEAVERFKCYNLEYPKGCIIAKVNMTDCVNVDEAIRTNLKHKNELVYRGIQDRNWHGYGFKLENVKNIKPIYINGKLGFWNYEKYNNIYRKDGGAKTMDLEKIDKNNTSIIKYSKTDNVLNDICSIINSARDYAFQSVNLALVERNWLIGYRIAEEELKGEDRANYGTEVIKKLSKELTKEYGKGFDRSNLYYFLKFYKNFPGIVDAVSRQSRALLSWSHYRTLLQVLDKEAREWYEKEALEQTWSTRTLQRNISSQYYYRLLKSQVKEPVIEEMKKVNENQYLINKLEFVKNPVIAEFLGYSLDSEFTETELETSIINNLQKFLMELWKRICFCCKTTTYSY